MASKPSQVERKVVILVIRHGIRNPKFIPEGWPLEKEIVLGEGALTEKGAA
jgi:broad specificity phosphatase PhoE